jgi:hypothetical protein
VALQGPFMALFKAENNFSFLGGIENETRFLCSLFTVFNNDKEIVLWELGSSSV